IFGEWTGNVRSTPTPNDCLRTVKVSRTPAPWRLITIPSNTCRRRRWPSITWKCTRTLSPALNGGRSLRSWRCSRLSITRFMKRGPAGQARILAHGTPPSPRRHEQDEAEREARPDRVEGDPVRRPIGHENLADDVLPRHGPPCARVAGRSSVVAHEEIHARPHAPGSLPAAGPARLDVRLLDRLAVDREHVVLVSDGVAGEPDQSLDEGPARVARLLGSDRGRVEDDDLATARAAEVVDEPVREHPVGQARLAPGPGPRAVKRRLHRRRRDPVRVDHPLLDREDDEDRAGDGHDPVDRDPPRPR